MDNPVSNRFPIKILAFSCGEDGEEIYDTRDLAEVTDAGDGFVEVAFDYSEERVYIAFRVSDLQRAIKDYP